MLSNLTVEEINNGLMLLAGMVGSASLIGKVLTNSMNKKIEEQFVVANRNIEKVDKKVDNLSEEIKDVKKDMNMVMKTEHIMLKHLVKKNSSGEMGSVLDEFDNYIIENRK